MSASSSRAAGHSLMTYEQRFTTHKAPPDSRLRQD